jgi:hypothetical protein
MHRTSRQLLLGLIVLWLSYRVEVEALLNGDQGLSTQTPQTVGLILRAIRSGALDRVDLLDGNSDRKQALLQFLEGNALRGKASSAVCSLEADLHAAIDALTDNEQSTLDTIVNKLLVLQRSISRL